MFTSPDGFLSGDDQTPWRLAQVSLERWERAVNVASGEYEELVRRLAEIFAQGNRGAWLDGREMTVLSRRPARRHPPRGPERDRLRPS